jgi:hypothetical protein
MSWEIGVGGSLCAEKDKVGREGDREDTGEREKLREEGIEVGECLRDTNPYSCKECIGNWFTVKIHEFTFYREKKIKSIIHDDYFPLYLCRLYFSCFFLLLFFMSVQRYL